MGLEGYEKTQDLDSKDTLRTVDNSAILYDKMNRKEKSKTLYLRIIDASISKKNVTNIELRQAVSDCFSLCDYSRAESLFSVYFLKVLKYQEQIVTLHVFTS